MPANCSAQTSSLSVAICSPLDLDIMASSSFSSGVAVKFWVPNLGARVPVDLTTGLPDYTEYVKSGLWAQRRRLRVCGGTGETAYMPDGDRSWPDTFPVLNMKLDDTFCEMQGVTQEKVVNPLSALEILEGQVALVHHIMAFEEANPAVHILTPRQKWKASFLAYFMGAVSKGRLMVMKQLGDESYAASLADQNCWEVRTSKRLSYALRHDHDLSLGRYNDALFENIDHKLQAFRWAPRKILGFLLGNTKTRFAVHVQLCRLRYDDIPSIDGISACRPSKGTLGCPKQPLRRLLESLCPWSDAEPLVTSFTPPATRTGKALRHKGWFWARPERLVSPAASLSTWLMPVAQRHRVLGRTSRTAGICSTAM